MYEFGYLLFSVVYTLFLFSKIIIPVGILLLFTDYMIRHFDAEDLKRQRKEAGVRAPDRLLTGRRPR